MVPILVMNGDGAANRVSLPIPTNAAIIGVGTHVQRCGMEADSVVTSLLAANANSQTMADARCLEGLDSWKAYSVAVNGALGAPNV